MPDAEEQDRIREHTRKLMDIADGAKVRPGAPTTKRLRRIMEHFWNRRLGRTRQVPIEALYFLEGGEFESDAKVREEGEVKRALNELASQGFLEPTLQDPLTPTVKGILYLERKHPSFTVKWQAFLDSTPPIWTLLVAVIGFVASVLGIWSFFFRGT